MATNTDGASSAAVDPGAGGASWDAVFSDASASTGIDLNAPLPADSQEPVSETPQHSDAGSSTGAPKASPDAPLAGATGDGGQGAVAATPAAATPAATSEPPTTVDNDSKPFTYTVDGVEKADEGWRHFPGDGVYIPEDQLQHVQLLRSRAETVERQNRELYDSQKALERLTEWKQTGPDGKEAVLTGREAVEASRVALGHALAEVRMLREIVDDPMKMAALLVHVGDNVFQHDPDRKALLGERLANLKGAVEHSIRRQVGQMASAPPPPVPALSAAEVAERALPTVEAVVSAAKITGLTPEDKQALGRMVPRFTTTVTPQNAAQFPNSRLGETVLDYAAFLPEVQDRAALRAAAIAAQTTAATVDKFNTGMKGGKVAPKAPVTPKKTTPPAQPEKVGKAAAWDKVFQEAAADIVV